MRGRDVAAPVRGAQAPGLPKASCSNPGQIHSIGKEEAVPLSW